ncbi:hypothetical protein Tco_0840485 [Tanacetum coccineum]|uniref:Reverse transcriptase domain-containing protein n=1 Tax=Tanacetum coccineum TaxID=301880 RepID=A0ABQ5AUI0_9ASTR
MEQVEVDVEGRRYDVRVKEVTGDEDGEYVEDTFNNGQKGGAENECHQQGQETNSEKEKVVDSNGDGGKGESRKEFEISTEYPPGFTPRGKPPVQEAMAASPAHDTESNYKQGKKTNSNHKKGSEQMNNSGCSGWGFKGPKPDKPVLLSEAKTIVVWTTWKKLSMGLEVLSIDELYVFKHTRDGKRGEAGMGKEIMFDFACSLARGLSGGILCVWNPDLFVKTSMVSHDHFVAVKGIWKHGLLDALLLWVTSMLFVCEKKGLDLSLIVVWRKTLMILSPKMSLLIFLLVDINLLGLIDMPLKMSKIDRILISDEMTERFPDLTATILDKGIPDHRPILVKEATLDYGPPPFRFFHYWIECKGLKNAIKIWSSDRRKKDHEEKHQLATNIKDIDLKADQGVASADDILARQAMEGLHMLIENAMNVSRIKGIEIDGSGIVLSHLFYADDVIFIGEWSEENVSNTVMLVQCFYLVSGLKINLSKCSLLRIGVQEAEVKGVADGVGCTAGTLPFTYLGVPIGNKTSKVNDWKDLIDKFKKRLSNWKIKTLSVGGRVTLLKSVLGSIAIYLMSIFKTPITVLNNIESIRNKFFLGAEMDERKLTWIQ